jgi:tetratricopeptide (TPR) repeat protein
LYRKFHLLKALLIQNPQITPLSILKRLEPYVGSKYESVKGLPTLKARFQGVSEAYKQSRVKGARLSVANSQRLMEIMEMPDNMLMASPVVFKKGPEAALDQLKGLYQDRELHSNRVKDLVRGPIESTKQLDKDLESQLIRQWFESKEVYDWIMLHESKQLQLKHLTNFNFQNKGALLTALDLRGAKQLNESAFMALHHACSNLVYLNISGWSLDKLCRFKESKFLGLELEQGPIFPCLKRLLANDCSKLKEVNVELPALESLEVAGNNKLSKFLLKAPGLEVLDLTGHQLQKDGFCLITNATERLGVKGVDLHANELIKAFQNQQGKRLDLSHKGLNDLDISFLATHLVFKNKMATCESINLSDNKIGDWGAIELAKILSGTKVDTVNLSKNQIGDSGAIELCKQIERTNLHSVNLLNNLISGSTYIRLADTLASIGEHYLYKKGHYAKARSLYEQALVIKEKEYGPNHIQTAITLENLGNAYGSLGDYTKGKELLERALVIFEKEYGPNHIQTAITLENLGNAYGSLGDYTKGKELLERALVIKEKEYGPNHIQTASTLENLGNAYRNLGNHDQQKKLSKQALKIYKNHHRADQALTGIVLNNLGESYLYSNNYPKSKKLLEQALEIETKHYGTSNPYIGLTLMNLGRAYCGLDNYQKGRELLEQALEIMVKNYGKVHS